MATAGQPYVSLIIPAFNEAKRIGQSLDRILEFFRKQLYSFEVIVVDDGSTDDTVAIVHRHSAPDASVRVETQRINLGKGEAIKTGVLASAGKYVFFSDADLSVPIETLSLLLSSLENGADLAIGSRRTAGARIEVHQPFHREQMGKVFTRLSNLILGLRVSDFTCGFKGFRKEAANGLFSRQRLGGWSFDAEILYLAKTRGYRIEEIPVAWRDDRATKVRLLRDTVGSFFGLLEIRLNDLRRKYR